MSIERSRPTPASAVLLALTILTLVAIVAISCATSTGGSAGAHRASGTTGTEDEASATRGGKLVFGLTAESSGWNPVGDQWALDGHFVASTFYDPLMAVSPDHQIVPELAQAVDHDESFEHWTLHLRSGISFHDGTPFDAEAVRANLDASRWGIGAVTMAPVESVEVLDPLSVVVNMKTPWSAFPSALTGQQGYMAAPSTLVDGSASTHPIGTGPFTFEQWRPDHSLSVRRNDRYWQTGKPFLDELEFRPIPDNATRSASLASGALDMILTYEPGDASSFRDQPGYRVLTDAKAEETVVVLDADRPPFDDDDARRAVALATDQQAVIDALGPGILEPANGPFAEGEPWYSPDTHQVHFDLDAARRLADSYRTRTGRPLSFSLTTFPDPTRLRQAQLLQQMWAKIGAQVHIETLDQAGFITPLINGGLDAAVISNFGTADPDFDYLFWHSSLAAPPGQLSINFSHTRDPQIDAALDAARRTDDVGTRAMQYQTVVRRLNEDLAYVWLYRTPTTVVASDRVHGLSSVGHAGFGRPDGKPWLAHLWMQEGE